MSRHGDPDAVCEECGDTIDERDISLEAFEAFFRVLCHDCAEPLLLEAKMDSEWGDD